MTVFFGVWGDGMTNNEKLLINSWSEKLLIVHEEIRKSYDYVLTKYIELTSSLIDSSLVLVQEIVKCKRVGDNQRKADLDTVLKYLISSGRLSALFSLLDLNIG